MSNETFFAQALRMKYAQQQQQINSQSQLNRAQGSSLLQNAATNRMDAKTNLFTAKSNDVVNRQNANTNRMDANNRFTLGTEQNSINRMDANNRFTLGQEQNAISRMDAENRFSLGQGMLTNNSRGLDIQESLGTRQNQIDFENALTNRKAIGLDIGGQKKGIARVPGKGSGDKVVAMLEPGEAILNKKAAGMMGRDKIAKMNAKGNKMRQKEDASKVAAMLKKLGMV